MEAFDNALNNLNEFAQEIISRPPKLPDGQRMKGQAPAGMLTNNVANPALSEWNINQTNPGDLTNNIGTIDTNLYNQSNPGDLTNNIGTIDTILYNQSNPGDLTNNVGNNDLDEPLFNQLNAGELTTNITNLDTNLFEQKEPGQLTSNIKNESLYAELIKQLNAGKLTDNIANENISENDIIIPDKKITKLDDELLFKKSEVKRKVQLDEITSKMKTRKNIGQDLGSLY